MMTEETMQDLSAPLLERTEARHIFSRKSFFACLIYRITLLRQLGQEIHLWPVPSTQ